MMDYRSLNIKELEEVVATVNESKFRGKQIFKWIHRGIEKIDDMTDLSINLREKLSNMGYIDNMKIVDMQMSKLDGTRKYLMGLKDGNVIECVLMKYSFGYTLCISTQVGCSMGCGFCASTIGGKLRDLTPGEMLGQIIKVQNDNNISISNIVLMGAGEPFDNYDNVIKFLEIINNKDGINIGMRHITISTCGLVGGIKKLADLKLQLTLAISLHAPNDEIRKKLMPIARKYSFDELIDACRYYIDETNKRITFEYALINGVNDSKENALELANKLRGLLCHVNLIPVNNVVENRFVKSSNKEIEEFKDILLSRGIETTVRRELGSDIDAACGQLRRKHIENN